MTETQQVESIAQPAYDNLDVETRKMLSKVLFPDTLTEEVTVLGKTRSLRALPIKWSKKLHNALEELTAKITGSQEDKAGLDQTQELVNGLIAASSVLADFYKWEDVAEAIAEEDILISELQALVIAQRSVQGTSDFTFQSCSLLVGLMQMSEIGVAVIMNVLSGQATSNSTDVALTN